MVPVSCPPWPASTTILPIFRPSARIRERSPAELGAAVRVVAAVVADARELGSAIFFLFLLDSFGDIDSNVGPLVGWPAARPESSIPPSSTAIFGVTTLAVSAAVCVITRSLSLSLSLPWPLRGTDFPAPASCTTSDALPAGFDPDALLE